MWVIKMYGASGTITENELLVCKVCGNKCDLWGYCDCGG